MDKLKDKAISAAKAVEKEIDKNFKPLKVLSAALSERLENSDEPVEFAAWHRVAQIKCGKLKNIKNYDDLVKNIELEDIYINEDKKKKTKEDFFSNNKFIHTNNDVNKLFDKIADDLKNGNAIKIKNNKNKLSRYNFLVKFKYIINYDDIKYEKINDNDDQINNDIINDSTIENIDKNEIKWFNFLTRYGGENYSMFNEDYSCNIDESAKDDGNVLEKSATVGGYNKYLKNKKKSKRKKYKVTKGGIGNMQEGVPQRMQMTPAQMVPGRQVIQGMPIVPGRQVIQGMPMVPGRQVIQGMPIVPGRQVIQGMPIVPGRQVIQGMPIVPGRQVIQGVPAGSQYYQYPHPYQIPYGMFPQNRYSLSNSISNILPQRQTNEYKTGVSDHKDIILIVKNKNDKKNRIEFYQPIDITKVKRLTYIVKGINDIDRDKEKKDSKDRLNNVGDKGEYAKGYLAQFGGSFEIQDIIVATDYTPIPILSVETSIVKYGLWNLENDNSSDVGYTVIDEENNDDGLDSLIKNLKMIISEAVKEGDPEKLSNQLNLTKIEGMKDLENKTELKDKIKYKFRIGNNNYCYKSSNVRVYLVKTSSEFMQSKYRIHLNDFKKFQNKIDAKIEDLKQREEKILQEATNNVNSNANRSDATEEKDNERVDKILMNLATFLAYAMKEFGKYLIKAITLVIMAIREVFIALRDFFANFVTGRWSDVAAGAVIFLIFAIIVLGITLGVIYGKKDKPVSSQKIDESNNVNKKTLYSIITALPTDISNAYNSFIEFAGTVNTMLFDAKKTISEITTESGYFENSELLEDRGVLESPDKLNKRVDYIMHFTKHDNATKVIHNYNPHTPITLSLGDNTQVGSVTISSTDAATNKYTPKCTSDATNGGYIGDDCKRKETECPDVSDIPQESVQQIQIEETDFKNDYDSIIVST